MAEIINKSEGLTESERYLAWLGEKSFLNLWSYPNVFKNDRKELCDLLVVFGKHVIIFSDKDIEFGNSGDLLIDWKRWAKKSILKSAKQAFGAERYILNNPQELYLDGTLSKKFPLKIPDKKDIKIHLILVTNNSAKRFKEETGDSSGTFTITPSVIGNDVLKTPFTIGVIDSNKNFVHILDEESLSILMNELDTISDFVGYLEDKENFITSGNLVYASGEEDLLGYYYHNSSEEFDPHFPITDEKVFVSPGFYENLQSLPQYIKGKEADKPSYFIDGFINHFGSYALQNELITPFEMGLDEMSIGLRYLASESRVARRIIANAIIEKAQSFKKEEPWSARIINSPANNKVIYVWLIVSVHAKAKSYEEHREFRRGLLLAYCQSAKLVMPSADFIIGFATDPPSKNNSEDMIFIDTTEWEEQDFIEAQEIREELNIFKQGNYIQKKGTTYQFPLTEEEYT